MNSHRSSHTHCQAAQSQAQTKACQRVCLPQPIENFKIFLPLFTEKIKTLQHTSDTDRKENDTNDKFNMKVQFDSNLRTDKNRQCITGGIFYCRESANLKGCSSLQTSSWLDSDVHRNRQQKHTANRCAQV
jgi:hypothetical protein